MGCGYSTAIYKPSEAVPRYFQLRRKAFLRAFPRYRFAVSVVRRRGEEDPGTTDDHVLWQVGYQLVALVRCTMECCEVVNSFSHSPVLARDDFIMNYMTTIAGHLSLLRKEYAMEERLDSLNRLSRVLELAEESLRHWMKAAVV
ncbi:unnamed protein product, partial [Symbiodinium sp. KB8]